MLTIKHILCILQVHQNRWTEMDTDIADELEPYNILMRLSDKWQLGDVGEQIVRHLASSLDDKTEYENS